ncbi:unnamed protein product [Acanthoscelides obtectus]|uniref:NADH dehydrogenase [ubiquinone] 1 beta subcomplex subunit 11, mitochondrial n=1 Tax=Acanthoscelides obtectus TaxID=200917 RepID=A0A9P0JMK5_ACAOB|nr:unnamed protein product [Acanthoscelides obtectus]CAK1621185.1 NADH dehydrogenase [ubiquinone] 1 beta subcomplex subunit 11, mitochondrial [Acanthoscelides obtectus]
MAGIILRNSLKRLFPNVNRRLVSTSKKNPSATATPEAFNPAEAKTKGPEENNWVSYGYDYKSKENDRNAMHSLMFITITLCITVGGFVMAYLPDYNLTSWAQREAYLELRRREAAGLPAVDPNYIDPAKMVLPTDEELGDTEIII